MRIKSTWSSGLIALGSDTVLASVGYAAIPSAGGVITVCHNTDSNPSGTLRVIDAEAGQKSAKNERLLSFIHAELMFHP